MIDDAALTGLIRKHLPDADVQIFDRTGTMDHFNLTIRSISFKDKSLLQQHRLVYGALKAALDDGRVHAVELKTIIPTEN
jgi:stress-induced morphogen